MALKEEEEAGLTLCRTGTQEGHGEKETMADKEETLALNPPCWPLDLGFQPPELLEDACQSCRPPCLWCFDGSSADSVPPLAPAPVTAKMSSSLHVCSRPQTSLCTAQLGLCLCPAAFLT